MLKPNLLAPIYLACGTRSDKGGATKGGSLAYVFSI